MQARFFFKPFFLVDHLCVDGGHAVLRQNTLCLQETPRSSANNLGGNANCHCLPKEWQDLQDIHSNEL